MKMGGWRSAPVLIIGIAVLILLAGLAVIVQNQAAYGRSQTGQAQVQADILAASVAAALDFNDPIAAQETVDAFRVNRQVRWLAVYSRGGQLAAGYDRAGGRPPQSANLIPAAREDQIRVSAPVVMAGQRVGLVFLELDREPLSRRLSRYLVLGSLFFLAALVVATLGLTQAQLRKANRELAHRADALARTNVRLEEEIEERAKAEDQLRQSQKMQALGQLTGGIAHDFNNLLTVIQGSADMLARPEIAEAKRIRFAQAIVQASGNAAALTSQLLAFARRQPLKPERLDLSRLIRDMDDLIDRTVGERIEVVTDLCTTSCTVEADKAQLQSAILNVASNARDAMPKGGRLTLRTREAGERESGRMVALEIADTGEGMSPDTLDRIFEPFFTTKMTGRGTGLGLSQVYGFASQSGGEVEVQSVVGEGTTLTILLPCIAGAAAEDEARIDQLADQPPATILVVEDNEEVGAFAEALLQDLGHSVTRACNAEDALELARAQPFDVVFSDVVMPGMGGLRLAEILAEEQPGLPVVLATGYSEEIAEAGSRGRPVILKPYRLPTLAEALANSLQGKGGNRPDKNAAATRIIT